MVALTLFSVLLRTLRLSPPRGPLENKSRSIALAVTLLWTVHPLLTESITSVIQRTELIVGFFYLSTFYCVIRSFTSTKKALWYGCAVAACLLGTASKEIMATAPVMVLLFDRAFFSGSFKKALTQRAPLYLGLAATWIMVGLLIFGANDRNGTVGFGHGMPWWEYAFTQCEAVVRYLGLALWPQTLIFDYGVDTVKKFITILPQTCILIALLAAVVYASIRQPKLGFAGCWFFGILAPSSSILPLITQTIAEHRMYLPLVSVVALAVVGLFFRVTIKTGLAIVFVLVSLLAWRTMRRNADYRSAFALWSDTISKRPGNARAYNDLGNSLSAMGKTPEALACYDTSLRIKPDNAMAYFNKAETLLEMGKMPEAIEQFDLALRITPDYVKALKGKGETLIRTGRDTEAVPFYEKALSLRSDDIDAAAAIGSARLKEGRIAESIERFESVVRNDPRNGEAHNNLGFGFAQIGRIDKALPHFETAIRLEPDSVKVHYNYAKALRQAGRLADAIDQYMKVIRMKPDYATAYYNLGNLYAQTGQLPQSVDAYEKALMYKTDYAEAHNNFGTILFRLGRLKEAREHYLSALHNKPDYPQAKQNLAALLKSPARPAIRK